MGGEIGPQRFCFRRDLPKLKRAGMLRALGNCLTYFFLSSFAKAGSSATRPARTPLAIDPSS